METAQTLIAEYRKQLDRGMIQKAYRELMLYVADLRTRFSKKHPELAPGSTYQGYMDMTYFPLFPPSLKNRKLKIAVVLIHQPLRFEVWLSGYNKQVQSRYWNLFKETGWSKYRLPSNIKGTDSILEDTLISEPDFSHASEMPEQIENGTMAFIHNIEDFLISQPD
jgi:Family of unknown function (DUF7000)